MAIRRLRVVIPALGANSAPFNLFRGESFTGRVFNKPAVPIVNCWIEVYSKTDIDTTGIPIPALGGNLPEDLSTINGILTQPLYVNGVSDLVILFDRSMTVTDSIFVVSGDPAAVASEVLYFEINVPDKQR